MLQWLGVLLVVALVLVLVLVVALLPREVLPDEVTVAPARLLSRELVVVVVATRVFNMASHPVEMTIMLARRRSEVRRGRLRRSMSLRRWRARPLVRVLVEEANRNLKEGRPRTGTVDITISRLWRR